MNLSGEEHATLAGLPLSRRSTKDLISEYNDKKVEMIDFVDDESFDEIIEDEVTSSNDDNDENKSSGQMTLF